MAESRAFPMHSFVLVLVAILAASFRADEQPQAIHLEFFEKDVRPLLVEHCF